MEIFWVIVAAVALFVAYRLMRKTQPSRQNAHGENTPYQGTLKTGNGLDLKYEVSVREKSQSEERASDLLKEATRLKEEDIDGAVSCLREAYDLIHQSPIIYPTKTFLRLPIYLQQGGRYPEAKQEFAKLLDSAPERIAGAFSHVSTEEQYGLLAMDRSIIYDKMRLAAQREKEYPNAAYFQVLSEAHAVVGLKLQNRGEADKYEDQRGLSNRAGKLLKKAGKQELAPKLVAIYAVFLESRTNKALNRLQEQIAELLELPNIKTKK